MDYSDKTKEELIAELEELKLRLARAENKDAVKMGEAAGISASQIEVDKKYGSVFENSLVGISLTTPDCRLRANAAYCNIVGYSEKELQGIKWQNITHPEDVEYSQKIHDQIISGEKSAAIWQKRFIHKSGKTIWAEISTTLQKDEKGNPLYYITIIHDITKLKQAEITITRNLQFTQALLNSIPFPVYYKDTKGRYLGGNKAFCNHAGVTFEEIVGKTVFEVWNPEYAVVFSDSDKLLFETEEHQEFESKIQVKDGTVIDAIFAKDVFYDETGNVAGIVGTYIDITDRKKAEIALTLNSRRTDVLLKLNQMTESNRQEITDFALEESVLITRSKFGYIVFLDDNESVLSTHSWSKQSRDLNSRSVMNDTNDKWLWEETVRNRKHFISNDYDLSSDKKVFPEGSEEIKRHMNVPIVLGKKIVCVAGVGNKEEDYTQNDVHQLTLLIEGMWRMLERKHAEEQLNEKREKIEIQNREYQQINEELVLLNEELKKSKEKAEESDRLKSAFLANMSHEIRTPMNGILGFAELLKEPGLSGENQKEFISIIEKSGERMLNLINDLVDISKIEAGQMEINITDTDVNERIEFVYNFFKPEAEQKRLNLIIKKGLPGLQAIIKTDSQKFVAILMNLVKNAIKFTDRGTIEFGYDVVYNDVPVMDLQNYTSLQLRFYIKDSGIGIPPDRQKAVFDSFVQADISDVRVFQGAGLGLSISKAYVEMLDGKIWLESADGLGSIFYFTIPFKPVNSWLSIQEPDVPEMETGCFIQNLKVMIVEDDKASEILMSMTVRSISREIIVCTNGKDAVETSLKNPDIDLILMDIKMPGIDGYEATRQIRQFNKNVIIIAQTAYALLGDEDKALMAGCNDYICKPTSRELLINKIGKYFIAELNVNTLNAVE